LITALVRIAQSLKLFTGSGGLSPLLPISQFAHTLNTANAWQADIAKHNVRHAVLYLLERFFHRPETTRTTVAVSAIDQHSQTGPNVALVLDDGGWWIGSELTPKVLANSSPGLRFGYLGNTPLHYDLLPDTL
jgi:hypothetical protein